MKLTRTMQALRRARKLRPCLVFHERPIGGIDVPKIQFERALGFIRCLVKSAEAAGCEVNVNHWGALFVTPPFSPAAIEVSIRLTSPALPSEQMETLLKNSRYRLLARDVEGLCLCAVFQVYRPGTKPAWFKLDDPISHIELAEEIVEAMIARSAQLVPSVRFALPDWRRVGLDDVLCVLRYGAYASYGQVLEKACYPIIEVWSLDRCEIVGNSVTFFSGRSNTAYYRLQKTERKFLEQLAPNIKDGRAQFVRYPGG